MKSTSRKSLASCSLALPLAFALTVFSCRSNTNSALTVGGGSEDATGKYASTVYVELNATDLNGAPRQIRNVGTLIDIGHPSKDLLILSLADALEENEGGYAVFPLFKTAKLTLHTAAGKSVELPRLRFIESGRDVGVLEDTSGTRHALLAVGITLKQVAASKVSNQLVQRARDLLFEDNSLAVGTRNFRSPQTTYLMLSVSKNATGIRAAPYDSADSRKPEGALGALSLVGYGELSALSDKSTNLTRPKVNARNVAPIVALNKIVSSPTPLRALMGSNESVSKQLWEVSGSGLCGSSDGENYDTGAAVYEAASDEPKFIGFGVRSTRLPDYKGVLDCKSTQPKDMVTLVVSPSKAAISQFIQLLNK